MRRPLLFPVVTSALFPVVTSVVSLGALGLVGLAATAGSPAAPLPPPLPGFALVAETGETPPPQASICVQDIRLLAQKLESSYAEVPVSTGLGQDGNLVSVFASPASGTWTLVTTRPHGESCVVAVGEAWQTSPVRVEQPHA